MQSRAAHGEFVASDGLQFVGSHLADSVLGYLTFIKTLVFGLLKLLNFLLSLFQLLFQCLAAGFLLFLLVCFRKCKLFIIGLCLFFGPADATSVVL